MKLSTMLILAAVGGGAFYVYRRRQQQNPLAGTPLAGTILDPFAWGSSSTTSPTTPVGEDPSTRENPKCGLFAMDFRCYEAF